MPAAARQDAPDDCAAASAARGRSGPRTAERPAFPPSLHLAGALAVGALLIAALYFGRDILIPLALALALACLLGFVLSPPLQRLKRWGLPRAAAVSLVLATCLALLAVAAVGLAGQVRALSAELPDGPLGVPVPAGDRERVRALQASGVLGEHLHKGFAAAAQRAADGTRPDGFGAGTGRRGGQRCAAAAGGG